MKKIILAAIACAIAMAVGAASPSGTLPVMTIVTDGNAPVVSKTDYLTATYSIDPMGTDAEALSGTMLIRGRGNWTWVGYDKKPYRLKLDKKAALLGMKKSKHFALLAHADDALGFLREPMGLYLSRLFGMPWTPEQKPIEVVLNGDYIGLYFLIETIRIDKDRVNITDQEDETVEPDVTGGWLCEIDNYEEPEQVQITGEAGDLIRITHHNPEVVSEEQRTFLRNEIKALDHAFNIADPASRDYEELVDLRSLAAFYVIQELMDGQESFHGSCYFYRDRGEGSKWMWGPVWDFGNTYMRSKQKFIWDAPTFGQTWIGSIYKFDSFREASTELFNKFVNDDFDSVLRYVDQYAATIADAARADAVRWPAYANTDMAAKAAKIKQLLKDRTTWLAGKWGVGMPQESGIYIRGTQTLWATDSDWQMTAVKGAEGTYELRDVTLSGEFKIGDATWLTVNWGAATRGETPAPGLPFALTSHGANMAADGRFARIVFTTDGATATLTMLTDEQESGIADIAATAAITVAGRTVTASRPVDIRDIAGRTVARAVTSATLAPGLYIIDGRKFAIF